MGNNYTAKTALDVYKAKIKHTIISNLKKLNKKKIVIFGATESSQIAILTLKEANLDIYVVIDNDPRWIGNSWIGIDVITPDMLKFESDLYFIVCTSYKYDKMMQLFEIGFRSKQILFIMPPKMTLFKKLFSLNKEWKFYNNLKSMYGNNILFCPYPGTGDAFFTGRYLKNLIQKLGLSQYAILVTGNSFKKVLELYGYNNCVLINRVEADMLKRLLTYFGEDELGIRYMLYWGLPFQNINRIEGLATFDQFFRYSVFPECNNTFENIHYSYNQNDIEDFMGKKNLKKNKTVIILPYANSFSEELKNIWWEKLAQQLKNRGYSVATNCGTKEEEQIKGTVRLDLDYSNFAGVAESSGYMIGIRSGLFDLMSGINCKKIILYQSFIRKDRMDFFSLNNMGLCHDAIEMKVDLSLESTNSLMLNILNFF